MKCSPPRVSAAAAAPRSRRPPARARAAARAAAAPAAPPPEPPPPPPRLRRPPARLLAEPAPPSVASCAAVRGRREGERRTAGGRGQTRRLPPHFPLPVESQAPSLPNPNPLGLSAPAPPLQPPRQAFAMSGEEVREEKEPDLSSGLVLMKYQAAARILDDAMRVIVSECKPKARIVQLCEEGDSYIKKETSRVYKRTEEKGLAFPTCVDMACQIDGFIAVLGHTHVVTNGPVMGRAADVLAAADTAAEVAMRLAAPGSKKKDVTEAIQKVAVSYDCRLLGDVHCHRMKKSAIHGNKFVPSADTKVDDAEFEENEVYAIDITMSSGEGKPQLLDEKQTTIYNSLAIMVVRKGVHMRALDYDTDRSALVHLLDDNCLEAYPVLHEKPGDHVAHIKFTALLRPNGSEIITSHPLQVIQSTESFEDNADIKEWLSLPINGGGRRKKAEIRARAPGFAGNAPAELLHEVFTHLEPWWFFRCSSVVKNWHKVITCKDLLKLRHERQRPRPIILHVTRDDKLHNSSDVLSFKLETFDLQSQQSCLIAKFSGATATKKYSFQMASCFKVHESCRGVLLMSFHEHLYLCNPMTRCWARFDYVHRAGEMLCLYHHQETKDYRILRKEDDIANGSSTYSVIKLDSERNLLIKRQVCQRHLDFVVDPAPVQVGDCVYWVHVLKGGNFLISVFNATREKLGSIHPPQLTLRQVVTSTELLEVNGQLAASVAWGSAQTTALEGPSSIELWKYKNSTWEFNLRVELPSSIKDISDSYVQFGLGDAGWKGFITDGDGNTLVHVASFVVWCDKNGSVKKVVKGDNHAQQLIMLPLMLKESLLPHCKLPRRYDIENLEPPFFENLTSSDTILRSRH
ncbi:hypothetical protein U9M48_026050 [Paspalum notatum var. saurae]|uniref:F-box domain-containing protein n=1 Tax=Paspalum notatum var. saurae TaxID=547442 RepID=A0AAQ3TQ40_PASNO